MIAPRPPGPQPLLLNQHTCSVAVSSELSTDDAGRTLCGPEHTQKAALQQQW